METKFSVVYLIGFLILLIFSSIGFYQLGFKHGEEKVLEDIVLPPLPTEVFTISGSIISLEGNNLTIEAVSPGQRISPFEEPERESLELFEVVISNTTKIFQDF